MKIIPTVLLALVSAHAFSQPLPALPSTPDTPAAQTQQAPAGIVPAEPTVQALPANSANPANPANSTDLAGPAGPAGPTIGRGDLWDRIRRGFAMPDLQDEFVANREQWYATRPDYITRMTERSKKYLYHIVEELEARKMPSELALLPFIESAFNPQAVSSAKAAGMWQFIPSTGRDYSLKQNMFRDDRRDVQASTRAALDYLQKLYAMFGDWHLALAAYNWGEGSVSRAIAKNQKLGLPTTYPDLKMPKETRYYVPKLQAVKNIVNNPVQFNTQLGEIDNHPYFQSVPITRDMDVTVAAKLAQVPLSDFKALNPSLSRPVILAAGTPQVLMPWGNAEIFSTNLDQYKGQLASWTSWIAPKSMKPTEVAKQVGMSESALRDVNGIALKSGLIKAGSTLLIPRSASKTEDVTPHVADNGQLTMVPPPQPAKCKVRTAKNGKKITVCAKASKTTAAAKTAAAPKTSATSKTTASSKRKKYAAK
ncbi:MAG: transglycosylase SLT domain-containing protein [Cytophagales bacterium]|nr:transglycosylase SLT domain-containing protein [Cytophagales bacterium]